jgi:hypothetical protein
VQLIGSGFKKGCVLLYYQNSSEFESTLAVKWNGVGAAGLSFFSRGCNWRGVNV